LKPVIACAMQATSIYGTACKTVTIANGWRYR
jgi:hypothetical protein